MSCNCKDMKVLLVDDVKTVADLKAGFDKMGISVITANTQKKAEELIKQGGFKAAVVGLMLENSDSGFVLSHKIKKLDPKIPVIMVTAVTRETGLIFNKDSDPYGWIKADVVLQKDVRFEQVLQALKKLMHCDA